MAADKGAPDGQREVIRVFVADATLMSNQLLAAALSRDGRFSVVGTAEGVEKSLAGLRHAADVAIVGGTPAGSSPAGHLTRQLSAHPGLRVIVLLESSERGAVLEAFRAGATGVFCRAEPVEALCRCIESVHRGKVWANDEELKFVLEELASAPSVRLLVRGEPCSLSERERKIVRLVAEGLTNRQIAAELGMNEHTLKSCLQNLFSKLDVSNRAEMVFAASAQARRGGFVPAVFDGLNQAGDDRTRLEWYSRAAERGFPLAQLMVGEMCLEGRGTPKDLVAAYSWFLLAEENARRTANTSNAYRTSLASQMTEEQVAQAEQTASEWLESQQPPGGPLRGFRDSGQKPRRYGAGKKVLHSKPMLVA